MEGPCLKAWLPLPTMGMALSKSTNFSDFGFLKGKFDRDNDQEIS